MSTQSTDPNSGSFNANASFSASAAQPPAPPSSEPRVQAIEDASARLAQLANEHSQPVPFLRTALRELVQLHRQLGFGMKGRCGPETLADFSNLDTLSQSESDQLRKLIDQNLLTNYGNKDSLLTGPFRVGQREVYLILISIDHHESRELVATFCFAMLPQSRHELDLASAELRAALAQAINFLPHENQTAAPKGNPAVEMAARVSQYGDTREFSFALVNSIAQRYDCQQVAFGLANQANVKVLAISGTDKFKASSPGVVDFQQAMEETFDAKELIAFQSYGISPKHNPMPVHTQWGSSTRTAVCSIPLMAGEDCVGVVSLRRDANVGFNEAELTELDSVIRPFGAAVQLAKRGERSLKEHFSESMFDGWRKAKTPSSFAGIVLRTGLLAAAIIFVFGWMPYKPLTPCTIVPSNLTQTLSAFDMKLEEVLVRSGDRVTAGSQLVKFDTRELELERATLMSQRDQAEIDVRSALVRNDAATASLAKANSAVFDTQIQAIDQKLAQCTLVAPYDGMVVAADLEQRIGQIFPQGSPILSFAPMNAFELEIRIPEHQARHFAKEQRGEFSPAADPGRSVSYSIENIRGSAELIDGKNVFIAKAQLDDASDEFRQGMEGYASTYTGWRPIPWIVFHRFYEYAASSFWL